MSRPRVAVAASGGLDSTALLHCTLAQGRALGVDVVALHVHHGLMPQADAWLSRVRRQALRWGAGFDARRLAGAPKPGDSVEAWAREGRYGALAEMANEQGCGLVLLAHHRRDQAETWLLQALRGAGEVGLSAMPVRAQRKGLTWARPWLELPREAIRSYAVRHRLSWIEDPSNADSRFARSRLRAELWPVLLRHFPDAEATLARAASHAQFAAALASDVAAEDLMKVSEVGCLHLPRWLSLSDVRRRNALRGWLHALSGTFPSASLIARLMHELPSARSGSRWSVPAGWLLLHRGLLSLQDLVVDAVAAPQAQEADLSQPGQLPLPAWRGVLAVSPCSHAGVPAELLRRVRIHARRGGEQFRLTPQASARSLKKQLQALGVPAWDRSGPLVSTPQGALLFVPHLGMEASHWAAPGAKQLRLDWVPR